jgi:hypothetical protein
MVRYLYLILAVISLSGCANTPMSVDLSQSEHLLQRKSKQDKASVSNVVITNKAEKTKLVNTPLGSDTLFPFNTDVETRQTVEADIRRFFDVTLDKNQKSSRSLAITINKVDGYWVWGGASKIPFVGLFTVGADTDFVVSLRVLFEIEEGGKVISSYLFDDKFVIQGSAATEDVIKENYQRLIAEYRNKFFSELDDRFVARYFK